MSDAIEDIKASHEHERQRRAEAWNNRAEVIAQIEAAGFRVQTVNEESRHLRVHYRGGWFDFWPTTERWGQSPQRGRNQPKRGTGIGRLLTALLDAARS